MSRSSGRQQIMRKICSTLAVLSFMVAALAASIPVGTDVGAYAPTVAITNVDNTMNHSAAIGNATAFAVLANEAVLFGNADNGAFAVNQPTATLDTGQTNALRSGSGSMPGLKFAVALVPEVTARSAPNGAGAHVAAG